jgi:hypothetical protein
MSSMAHGHCPPNALCDRCLEDAFGQFKGVAACRGEAWARDVAKRIPREMPWPSSSPKITAIAQRKVADITADPRLRERLAAELAAWAAKAWARAG